MAKSKSVSLPFTVPMFATFHYSAAAGIAFARDSNAEKQILNQGLEIVCDRKFLRGYTTPLIEMWGTSLYSFSNLQRYIVHLY